jgi:diaminopimelate epimerase
MASKTHIAFRKMNGLGNAFVVIDARTHPLALTGDDARALADAANPATKGCDQVLLIHPSREANADAVFMQIFNADGGEVEACGNGARAVAAFLAKDSRSQVTLETLGGVLHCSTQVDADTAQVSIHMPLPIFGAPVSLHADLPDALPVNMGNPHGVFFIETDTQAHAADIGPALEHHAVFPEGANINFARLAAPQVLRLDTWERGAGLTLACGTGACATAAAAVHSQLCEPGAITVRPPFNQDDNAQDVLVIEYQPDTHLIMTGPAQFEFSGEVNL